MSLISNLRSFFTGADRNGYVQFVDSRGMFEDYILGLSPEDMFRTQPNMRTLITFLARNIAQLGVHTYKRVSDTDRVREREDPLALLLKSPNDSMTTYELVYRWVADRALYDEALWVIEPNLDRESGWELQPIPPKWISRFGGGDHFGPAWVEILPPGATKATRVPKENYLYFHGWDPVNRNSGSTPVSALKAILQEQIHAIGYRDQIWRRAGRVGVTVTRPAGGSTWTPEQKRTFKEILDSKMAGKDGADAGGSIILEDGMTMKREGFSAHEEQFVEHAKLALSTVCQVYHVNPTMVGQNDAANFSNVREFRRMLYGETLGPIINELTAALNSFLVPMVALEDGLYVELNVEEKLRGSFEEQAAVMSTLVGRPIFTLNEGRALYNKPAMDGGDVVVTPLNVLIGGQASPQDGTTPGGGGQLEDLGEQSPEEEAAKAALAVGKAAMESYLASTRKLALTGGSLGKPQPARTADSKARAGANYEANTQRVLKAFFKRQRASVLSAMGAKAADWWDADRWDKELGDDLYRLAVLTATQIGEATAQELGFSAGDYDESRTLRFLRAVADSRAESINAATYLQLQAAADGEDGALEPAQVFDVAEEQRSGAAALALVTMFSAFATVEAAVQTSGGKAEKIWQTNSKDPRAEHAKMNGERVPIESKFSNGADWPGDPVLGADGVAGCKCSVEVVVP